MELLPSSDRPIHPAAAIAPLGAGAPPPDVLDAFGGRAPEGEVLLAAHARAQAAGGGVLLLSGPRGVGKGKLVAGLRNAVARLGRGPVFVGTSQARHRPYAALADVLREALGHLDTMGQGHVVRGRHAGALTVLDATLLNGAPEVRAPASRLAFHEATLSLVRDVGSRAGATLALCGLESADEDTQALARYLGLNLAGSRGRAGFTLLLVASDDGGGPALVGDVALTVGVEVVRVRGLDREGLLRFLRSSVAVDRLLAASGGRPDDVDELLGALPADAAVLVDGRLDRLGAPARAVADALAVAGRCVGVDVLCAMTGQPAPALAPALQALVAEGLCTREVQNGALLFTLARPGHAERLRGRLSGEALRRLHLRLGEHLEAQGAQMMEGGDLLLAQQFLAGGDGSRGVAYALAASERLTATHAYGASSDILSQALPVATRAQDRQAILWRLAEQHELRGDLLAALVNAGRYKASLPPGQRAVAYRRLGELLAVSGRPGPAVGALGRALDALALQPEGGAERALTLAALAEALYVSGRHDESAARARHVLAESGAAEPVRVRARNTLGKVALAAEDWPAATAHFEENRLRAEALGLTAEVCRAEINLGVMAFRRGQYDAAEGHLSRALHLAEQSGDLPNQAFCVLNLGSLKHQGADLCGALKLHHEALALFRKIGNRAETARAALNVANLSLVLGDLSGAEEEMRQARTIVERDGLSMQRAYLSALEGDLALARGQLDRALSSYDGARRLYEDAGQRSRVAEQWLRSAQVALARKSVPEVEEALDQVGRCKADLDHPRLRAEAALVEARAEVLGGLAGPGALSRVGMLLDEARAHVTTPPDHEALAMVAWAEAEMWLAKADPRRAEKLLAVGRDHLHRAGGALPPPVRDAYARTRMQALGAPVLAAPPAVLAAPRSVSPASPAAAPAAGVPVPSDGPRRRTPQWEERYRALVGESDSLLRVFARLDRLAGSLGTVLVRGESGTGKELVANALHALSPRAGGPLVKVNCAALVETLLLSELFGHEKGAFTGAYSRKVGRFELARGGTIFLDEIGDISPKTQVSLLRVLQEKVFERVGGTVPLRADCRVLCATNRDLEAMVKAGTFREDLYYRLKGVVVEVPALRERREDIPALVRHVVGLASAEMGRTPPVVDAAAMEQLRRYDWPGNVRELENTVRSLVLFADGDVIGPSHLSEIRELAVRPRGKPPQQSTAGPPGWGEPGTPGGVPLGTLKKQVEQDAIARALEEGQGNITRAAELLQMKRPRLSQIVNGNPVLRGIKDRFRGSSEAGGGEP
jgi:DNA-binding NtrC family response regulator/tetratricopeptide (TPR) repeat protein